MLYMRFGLRRFQFYRGFQTRTLNFWKLQLQLHGAGLRDQSFRFGLGFRVWGFWGLGFRAYGVYRLWGLGSRVPSL